MTDFRSEELQQAQEDMGMVCLPCMVVYARMMQRQLDNQKQVEGDREAICPKCLERIQRLQEYFLDANHPHLV